MKVINFLSGPCAGKSTLCAGLFYEMKKTLKEAQAIDCQVLDLLERHNIPFMRVPFSTNPAFLLSKILKEAN